MNDAVPETPGWERAREMAARFFTYVERSGYAAELGKRHRLWVGFGVRRELAQSTEVLEVVTLPIVSSSLEYLYALEPVLLGVGLSPVLPVGSPFQRLGYPVRLMLTFTFALTGQGALLAGP